MPLFSKLTSEHANTPDTQYNQESIWEMLTITSSLQRIMYVVVEI